MSALGTGSSFVPQWVRFIGTPVWISGPDRRIAWLNSGAERLLGRRAQDCIGRCCYSVVAARDLAGGSYCEADCEVLRRAQAGLPLPVRRLALDGDAARVVYLLAIPVRATDGGPLLIVHCAVEGRDDDAPDAGRGATDPRGPLTPREREVLDRLVAGAELRRIAGDLGISYSTVRNHVQHILNKLDVHSIREAIVRVLSPPSPRPNSAE